MYENLMIMMMKMMMMMIPDGVVLLEGVVWGREEKEQRKGMFPLFSLREGDDLLPYTFFLGLKPLIFLIVTFILLSLLLLRLQLLLLEKVGFWGNIAPGPTQGSKQPGNQSTRQSINQSIN